MIICDSTESWLLSVMVNSQAMTLPNGRTWLLVCWSLYRGRGRCPRDEQFYQIVTVLERIWYVSEVSKVPLTFRCPYSSEEKQLVSCFLSIFKVRTDWWHHLANESLLRSLGSW